MQSNAKLCIHWNVEMAYQNYIKKITDRETSVSSHKRVQLRALLTHKKALLILVMIREVLGKW